MFSFLSRWYHENKDREQAEEMLKKIPIDGAFLVRRSDTDQFSYAISFRYWKTVIFSNLDGLSIDNTVYKNQPFLSVYAFHFIHLV